MQRLSSNFTLFFKLFVPTAWLSFFGLFGIVMFIVDTTDKPLIGSGAFRLGYMIFFVVFLAFIYFTIYQLKRVEHENRFMFVTDYFKTVRFPFENIAKITKLNLGLFTVVWLHLKKKGKFGKRIPFLAKRSNFSDFEAQFSSLFLES